MFSRKRLLRIASTSRPVWYACALSQLVLFALVMRADHATMLYYVLSGMFLAQTWISFELAFTAQERRRLRRERALDEINRMEGQE